MRYPITSLFFLIVCLCFGANSFAQAPVLPHGYAPWELEAKTYYVPNRVADGITDPPVSTVRASAEWEEIDALMVTWTGFTATVREIVRYAKEECLVYIICSDSNTVKDNLVSNGISLDNIQYIDAPYNSIWIRDYGPWNVYTNQVDSLNLIDWIYNRPRPFDDDIPNVLADSIGLPIYQTTNMPYDLVHTGGNFMTDGWGTGFSSKLVLEENDGNDYSEAPKTEGAIDSIMNAFMGIERYVKMETLPYDEIHHIDMHMKLLDEETILVGEYPEGIADGPQIEENLQYILDNYNSVFGTPYKVVRVPMPPDFDGQYPDDGPWWNTGDYRTYTNFVFVNKTILVPVYEETYDSTALRILEEELPGYNIVGIECNDIIQSLGAIHCITKEVSDADPLLITHQALEDTDETFIDYQVDAWILHRDGVEEANLYYTTETEINDATFWDMTTMGLTDEASSTFTGFIPALETGTTVSYYIHATANNGKEQVRPITAPDGYWRFDVGSPSTTVNHYIDESETLIFPNPANDLLMVQLNSDIQNYSILSIDGRVLKSGSVPISSQMQSNISDIPSGIYLMELNSDENREVIKFVKQ